MERIYIGALRYFNSHTPCGVRRSTTSCILTTRKISTHTPHAGCDHFFMAVMMFLPISTHTPHAGCDYSVALLDLEGINFNSHTPCGVRRNACKLHKFTGEFQLTHPMWGATSLSYFCSFLVVISTHTPHVGCDPPQPPHRQCGEISTHTPHVGCDVTNHHVNG